MDLPQVVPVGEKIEEELLEDHKGERTGWYFAGNNKYLLPSRYAAECNHFYDLPVRKDDIWICTFPRSGTTLTQELVWILVNNFDFSTAKKIFLWDRTPFFELNLFFHEKTKKMFLEENSNNLQNKQIIEKMSRPCYETAADMTSPRIIKTHFPLSLLPKEVHQKKAKIIYIARNPKDVVPSYYYLLRLWRTSDYVASFKTFWEQFKKGLVPWGPYWSHILEAWDHRNDDNVLVLFYEDIVKDLEAAIISIANFLSVSAPPEKVKLLKEHLDIKNFSSNPVVNFEALRDVGVLNKYEKSFVRKGQSREKPEDITEDIEKEMLDWIEENYKETSLRFPSKSLNV